jgi:hypothetical protein
MMEIGLVISDKISKNRKNLKFFKNATVFT